MGRAKMKEKKANQLLTEGPIGKRIIAFAIPLFLGNLFQQLYNVADSLIVGNFVGSEGLAAVSSSGSLIFLMVGFFNGLGLGAGVIISRYFGAKDYESMSKAIHTQLALSVISSLILTMLGVVFTPMILKLMGTPASVLPNSILYFRIYFLGSLAVVVYNAGMGILQAIGDSKRPLYYLIISSVVNVLLDLLLVGYFQLGVGAAAFATIVSQFVSASLCIVRLMRSKDVYRVEWKKIRIDVPVLKKIIQVGLPSGMQNSIISFANIIVQSNINAFDVMAVAGCGVYSKIEGFAFLPITSFAMALTTFVGQNLGAGKYERTQKGTKFGIICSVVLAELIGIAMFIGMPMLVWLFDREPQVIAYGTLQARTECLFFCLLAFSHCVAGILRGAGKSGVPMLVMLVCWCMVRISYITVAVRLIPKIQVIFWAYPLTWGLSSILFFIYYRKANWLYKKL